MTEQFHTDFYQAVSAGAGRPERSSRCGIGAGTSTGAAGAGSGEAGQQSGPSGDNVVDADFEVVDDEENK